MNYEHINNIRIATLHRIKEQKHNTRLSEENARLQRREAFENYIVSEIRANEHDILSSYGRGDDNYTFTIDIDRNFFKQFYNQRPEEYDFSHVCSFRSNPFPGINFNSICVETRQKYKIFRPNSYHLSIKVSF